MEVHPKRTRSGSKTRAHKKERQRSASQPLAMCSICRLEREVRPGVGHCANPGCRRLRFEPHKAERNRQRWRAADVKKRGVMVCEPVATDNGGGGDNDDDDDENDERLIAALEKTPVGEEVDELDATLRAAAEAEQEKSFRVLSAQFPGVVEAVRGAQGDVKALDGMIDAEVGVWLEEVAGAATAELGVRYDAPNGGFLRALGDIAPPKVLSAVAELVKACPPKEWCGMSRSKMFGKHLSIYQYGAHRGQEGRQKPGLCVNVQRSPDRMAAAKVVAQFTWLVKLLVSPKECLAVTAACLDARVPVVFPHTREHALALSLDYVVPTHLDRNDAGPAVLTVAWLRKMEGGRFRVVPQPSLSNAMLFPEVRLAVDTSAGSSSLVFTGAKLVHATLPVVSETEMRVGFGAQSSAGMIRLFGLKAGILQLQRLRREHSQELADNELARLAVAALVLTNGAAQAGAKLRRNMVQLAERLAGWKREDLAVALEWAHIEHLFRMQPDVRVQLAETKPVMDVYFRDGRVERARLVAWEQHMVVLCPVGGDTTRRRRVEAKDLAAAVFADGVWPAWLTGGASVLEVTTLASGKRLGVHYPAEGCTFWGQYIDCLFIYDDGDLVLEPKYWITGEDSGRGADPRPDGCVLCDEETGAYLTWSADGTVSWYSATGTFGRCRMVVPDGNEQRRRSAIFQRKAQVQWE